MTFSASGPDAKDRLLQHLNDRALRCSPTAHFLLVHGTWYEPRPLPDDIERGPRGECYETITDLLRVRPDLRYVEGWAVDPEGGFVEHHAWTLDSSSHVVDPTFDGLAYIGFPRLVPRPFYKLLKRDTGFDRSIILSPLHELAALWHADEVDGLK